MHVDQLTKRKIKAGLELQELTTEFTKSIKNAWDNNTPNKVP